MCNKELIALISEYQAHDTRNFEKLFAVFENLIYSYGKKQADSDAVQDLSDFFVELLFKIRLSKFENNDSDSLQRHIAVCIRNEHNRMCKIWSEHLPLNEELIETLTENGICNEDRLFLKECLAALTALQRKVLLLRYVSGYSDSEIADLLHISRQAVGRLRSRAIESIRKKFKIPIARTDKNAMRKFPHSIFISL